MEMSSENLGEEREEEVMELLENKKEDKETEVDDQPIPSAFDPDVMIPPSEEDLERSVRIQIQYEKKCAKEINEGIRRVVIPDILIEDKAISSEKPVSNEICVTSPEGKKIILEEITKKKPLAHKTLSEIGVLTDPPFEGAVEGVDYITPIEELDEHGKPTGKKFIPGGSYHVRKQLDPFYGKSSEEMKKRALQMKQYLLEKFGVEKEDGSWEIADPDDPADLELLVSQRGMDIFKKNEHKGPFGGGPVLSGGFGTTPEKQGFKRSGAVPIQSLMLKLSFMANSLKYEMQKLTEIGLDILVKTPPYFAVITPWEYTDVSRSSYVITMMKLIEDMWIHKYPFERNYDFTYSGTGMTVEESLPELERLSLGQNEMRNLGIESEDPKQTIQAGVSNEEYEEDSESEEEEIEPKNPPEGGDGTSKKKKPIRKRKLRSFYLMIEDTDVDPMDWCPHFKTDSPESSKIFSDVMKEWLETVFCVTDKELEAKQKAEEKECETKNRDMLSGVPKEFFQETESGKEEEKMEQEERDPTVEAEDERGENEPVNFHIPRSQGEPVRDWLCSFGDTKERSYGAISSFFRRFVREGWLIKLISRDMSRKEGSSYIIAECLLPIVEHWQSQCTLDMAIVSGGHEALFPTQRDELIEDFGNFILNQYVSIIQNKDGPNFSYLDRLSRFLGDVSTFYVLGKIWKNPKDVVDFKCPKETQVIKLLMRAENAVSPLQKDDIPIPNCDDCEAFHFEWSYHWKNRQLSLLDEDLINQLSKITDECILMYKMELTAISDHKFPRKIKLSEMTEEMKEKLPPDPFRDISNGDFEWDLDNPDFGEKLHSYPKLLHMAFEPLHTFTLNKIIVLNLYIQLLSARWVPVPVRMKFGFVPTGDITKDTIEPKDIKNEVMKRFIFTKRADMKVRLESIGLTPDSPIYDLIKFDKDNESYPELDLEREKNVCLFNDVSFPELDLMRDNLIYIATVFNKNKAMKSSAFTKNLELAIKNKPKLLLTDNVDIGTQFTASEMQHMIESTEGFSVATHMPKENPKKRDEKDTRRSNASNKRNARRRKKKRRGRRS